LVSDLFRNIDRKDPRQLLRRINSTQYYPTYGDDSTLVEDTPSQGRFYLRAQKDASQLVIGNFATSINSTELAQLDRGLFGALLDVNSKAITSFGEHKSQVTAFASQPGTVPGRDEFRGTGGSLYFLKRQDLSVGSERIRVEIRDLTTGLVLETRELRPQEDYDFDPYQGRLTLLKPLASFATVSDTVRSSNTPGNIPVLVVRYEYTPTLTSLSGYVVGGRATQWLGDQVRLGVSAQRDATQDVDQTLLGTDVLFRYAAGTYVKAEVAQTKGPGFGQSNSVDGGFGFADFAAPGAVSAGRSRTARAWRGEIALNFAELAGKTGNLGKASGYFERTDAGFSAVGRLTQSDTERFGAAVALPVGSSTQIAAKFDQINIAAGGFGTAIGTGQGRSRAATADIVQSIGEDITAKLGVRYEARNNSAFGNGQNGTRTDAAFQLDYAPRGKNYSLFGFGQLTLDRDASRTNNNRGGIGGKAQLTDRLSVIGEVSGGSGGLGADVKLNHRLGEGSEAYIGYAVFADRTNTGLAPQNLFNTANGGTLTVGARQRYSDALSVNGEQRLVLGGSAPSLVRAFGLTYEPDGHFSVSGSFETGRVEDALTGIFRRTAATVSGGYTEDDVRVGTSIEARFENSAASRLSVWLFRNTLDYRVNPDWRFLGRLNFAVADSNQPSIRAADFVEAVAGFAYRPVDNEKLNLLARVTYLEDLGPVGQISGSGTTQNPRQISSIASIDLNYDITPKLTLGAKYGYREGRVSTARGSNTFVSSTAHLGVLRLDYRVAKQWDALIEGRVLALSASQDKRFGALGALYRHLGKHVKIGAGYSFSSFSDDLTDQSNSSKGPFINLIGKF
jgi:hypothetical protein